jgi:hypothetical protein
MEMTAGAWFGRAMVGLIAGNLAGIVAGNLARNLAGSGNPGRILMFCQPSSIAAVAGDTCE